MVRALNESQGQVTTTRKTLEPLWWPSLSQIHEEDGEGPQRVQQLCDTESEGGRPYKLGSEKSPAPLRHVQEVQEEQGGSS